MGTGRLSQLLMQQIIMGASAAVSKVNYLDQPVGGLFRRTYHPAVAADETKLTIRLETVGEAGQIFAHSHLKNCKHPQFLIQGCGVGVTAEEATVRARGEAVERYCSSVFNKEQFVVATAEELGPDALDLDTIPRCSETELANPKCPLVAPDKKAPMRWVRAVSLLDGRLIYVPVTMVYLYCGFGYPSERVCFIISTGCAAHLSLERALVSAILEVVERDATSITWLQKLPLPRIEIDQVPPSLVPYWERYQAGVEELEYIFFDATTDLGIPTIYGLQISRANKRLKTLVSCGSALEPAEALASTMREMASSRIAFYQPPACPERVEEFTEILHGATYMAREEHAEAFDFLLKSGRRHLLSQMQSVPARDDKEALQSLLNILRAKNLQAYAVELSTDEALRAGLRAVRVVIPGLQPLSFNYCGRFLGHPRLYQAPANMGYPVWPEEQLNQWPQPFA